MNEKMVLNIYRQYLVQIALKEGRGFKLPKTTEGLDSRADSKFFYALAKIFEQKGLKTVKQISTFMEVARKDLVTFHISDIVDGNENLFKKYKEVKEDNDVERDLKIKKSFSKLSEYCFEKNINSYEDLFKGSPPLILKLWKKQLIDDRIVVYLVDLKQYKKQVWYRIYCSDLSPKVAKINKELGENVGLVSILESELLKFKYIFN